MPGTGAPDFGGSALIQAEQIVLTEVTQTLSFGTSKSFTVPVTRPAYLMRLELQNTTDTTTIMPVAVQMAWTDTASGIVLDFQQWNMFAADDTGKHIVVCKGPCAGNDLTITIFNNALTAATLTYSIYLAETGQYFTQHDWRTQDQVIPKFPGYLQPNSHNISGVPLILDHISVPAGASQTYAMPLYSGPATLTINISSGGGDDEFVLINGSDVRSAFNALWYVESPTAEGGYPTQIFLPRTQGLLQIANFKTIAEEISFTIIAGLVT